ncbi:MAG: DUF4158 domain-containing protein [Thiovulaceae bacterium]|nr:DUF4158 domain-containing protein [Sulfurimonadaceae bacterium]
MTYIKVLNYSQKKEFETPPQLNDEMRREIFAVPSLLSQQLYSIDLADNRVKFIAMFGYFKLTRCFYDPNSFHHDDIDYICKRFELKIDDRSSAKNTLSIYKRLIRDHFGYQSPDDILRQILTDTANKLIAQLPTPKALFYALVELAIEHRYEVPSYTFLSKIITEAMNDRRTSIFDRLQSYTNNDSLQVLEFFTQTDETLPGRYVLNRFKKFSHSLKPSKIKEEVRTYEAIRNINGSISTIVNEIGIEENTARHYAQWVEKSDMHQTKVRSDQLCDMLV